MELYCHRSFYLSELGKYAFERGKTYKGNKVIIGNLNSNELFYIRVYIDDVEYRYFKPSSDSDPSICSIDDYFMSIEKWRDYQISKVLL